jgi:hypothetical protein
MMFDPTSILKDWGVTLGILGGIAFVATLVLIFSFREFAYWFLRLNQVAKKQDDLMEKVSNLEALLQKQSAISSGSVPNKTEKPLATETSLKKKFPIAKAEAQEGPEFELLN